MSDMLQAAPRQTPRHGPRDKEAIPRVLLIAMAALVLSSLAIVSYATLSGRPLTAAPADGVVAQERIVHIVGAGDGGATVLDQSGELIAALGVTEGGFVAGVARALSHERGKFGIDPAAPVLLVRFEDGRIALFDDLTNQRVEIMGFGRDNLAAFGQLFANPGDRK